MRAAALLIVALFVVVPCMAQIPMECGMLIGGQFHTLVTQASDGSYYNWWDFNGVAGQTVRIEMRSFLFDTNLILLDPEGRPVAQNDDASPDRTDSLIEFTLTGTGTWQIIANSALPGQLGDYKMTLECSEAPPPPTRKRSVKR
jgi:hypothetical protein